MHFFPPNIPNFIKKYFEYEWQVLIWMIKMTPRQVTINLNASWAVSKLNDRSMKSLDQNPKLNTKSENWMIIGMAKLIYANLNAK